MLTTTPKTITAARDRTFFAKKPIKTPTIKPLNVDPITIPIISGRVSGADTSADKPSNTPSTPPSNIANRGFFTPVSPRRFYYTR